MKLSIASDHAGIDLKRVLKTHIEKKGLQIIDFGPFDPKPVDYPQYAELVVKSLLNHECEAGILICGTGIGMAMTANKFKGIRAAVLNEPLSARFAKEHSNANIICFGARLIGPVMAIYSFDSWYEALFEVRHQHRLDLIEKMREQNN